jgi:hypothetical protein
MDDTLSRHEPRVYPLHFVDLSGMQTPSIGPSKHTPADFISTREANAEKMAKMEKTVRMIQEKED